MKLQYFDLDKVNSAKPYKLSVYNDREYSEEEFNFITSYMYRIVPNISIVTKNNLLKRKLSLCYPIHTITDDIFIGKASQYRVEIDINSVCNLSCNNCNRFSNYKSTWFTMGMETIEKFIEENHKLGTNLTVCILGGEPTLHKDINEIIIALHRHFCVVLSTNGIKKFIPPVEICIENSSKEKGVQYDFAPTMLAPKDVGIPKEEYMLGCRQADTCGAGYSSLGYYFCSIAKALDKRLVDAGVKESWGSDTLGKYSKKQYELCGMCGSYFNNNYIKIDKKLTKDIVISESWSFMKNLK